MTIPTKLQSYLACGIPIIASGEGEMCDIVTQAGAGLCAKTGSPAALADCVERFAALDDARIYRMRSNALHCHQLHFNKTKLMDRMDDIITETILEEKQA